MKSIKLKCTKCYKVIEETKMRFIKYLVDKQRTNYPFGKRSRGRTVFYCFCGGIMR